MPGTRTAPAIDGSPTFTSLSLRWIDASGDLRTTSLRLPPDATVPEIEAVVANAQAISNASVYQVNVVDVYTSTPDDLSALNEAHESLFDNIALNCKDVLADSQQTAYIPAPLTSVTRDGDVVDTVNVAYQTWRDSIIAALGGNYAAVTVRYTERRKKADSTPA